MKSNEKDPYNFEKIDGYLNERKRKIGAKKQMYGKVYMKIKNDESKMQNEGRE